MSRRNRNATAATIRQLRRSDRLDLADAVLIGLVQTTAESLDLAVAFEEKGYAVAKAATVHLQASLALLGRFPAADASDGTAEMLTWLRAAGPNTWSVGPMGDALWSEAVPRAKEESDD